MDKRKTVKTAIEKGGKMMIVAVLSLGAKITYHLEEKDGTGTKGEADLVHVMTHVLSLSDIEKGIAQERTVEPSEGLDLEIEELEKYLEIGVVEVIQKIEITSVEIDQTPIKNLHSEKNAVKSG